MTQQQLLVLDAGDALIKDRTPATSSRGQSSIEAMNMMGYDAMALGEGDLSLLSLEEIRQRIEEANFPVLSANAWLSQSGELLAEPYVVREMGEHRIAIIGLTGVATVPGIEIRDPLQSARKAVDQVRGQADIIILLSHAGLDLNREIGAQIPEIDLIVSGGGMAYTPELEFTPHGPPVVHADVSSIGHAGRMIGAGTWSFDSEGQLVGQTWERVALESEISDDPEMSAWVSAHP